MRPSRARAGSLGKRVEEALGGGSGTCAVRWKDRSGAGEGWHVLVDNFSMAVSLVKKGAQSLDRVPCVGHPANSAARRFHFCSNAKGSKVRHGRMENALADIPPFDKPFGQLAPESTGPRIVIKLCRCRTGFDRTTQFCHFPFLSIIFKWLFLLEFACLIRR